MAEQDDGDKTEEPSGKRIEDARKKGQFAKSKEFTALSVLLVGYSGVLIYGPEWGHLHRLYATNIFSWTANVAENPQQALVQMIGISMQHFWDILGIPMVLLWVFVVVLNMMHNRFVIPEDALKFDLKKLNPISNAKEKFFSLNPLVELVKSLMKLFLLGYVAWRVISAGWLTLPTLIWAMPTQSVQFLMDSIWSIFWGCMPIVIVIAIMDFGYQWYETRKKLMMSRQEIKDEMKNSEGNPEVKREQRKRAQQRLIATIQEKVPKADVVVVNPTHFAVALRYNKSEADAPVVVAKGVDFLAMRIRLLADQHDVPIVENPPLARGLYFQTKEGQQIPPDFYTAVAEILAAIYRRRNRKTQIPM